LYPTLLNIIAGALEPTSGSIETPGAAGLGMVFQDDVTITNFMPVGLTVREHLQLLCELNKREDVSDALTEALGLEGVRDTRSTDLSGGEKRRLCLAMAMAKQPQTLVLDEPTAGVDVQGRQSIWQAIASMEGSTCFINTHSVEEAESFASKLLVLHLGRVLFFGSPAQLREQYKCGYQITLIDEGVDVNAALAQVQTVVPEATLVEDKPQTVHLPCDLRVAEALGELGDFRYVVHVERLESTILKLVVNAA
jgi:ABC-type multidrug transport system ATPase subunit